MEFSGWPSKEHCIWNDLVQTVVEKIIFLKTANEILVWESHTKILLKYINIVAAAAAKLPQSCLTLCDPIDSSPPGSTIPGILQARTPEWAAISFSNAWKWKVKVKSLSCTTLCDPTDYSLPGSSVHGIFPGKSTGVSCHCFLCKYCWIYIK